MGTAGLGGGHGGADRVHARRAACWTAAVGRALAVLGLPVLLAPIFGPILGGVIIDEASLRWVFVVNLRIATAAIAAVALERDVRPVRRLDDPHRAVRVARRSLARRLIDVGLLRPPRFCAAALGGRVSPLRSSGRSLRCSFTTGSSAAGARCGRGAILPIAGRVTVRLGGGPPGARARSRRSQGPGRGGRRDVRTQSRAGQRTGLSSRFRSCRLRG